MRKIVDSNMLNQPEFRTYLSKSPNNFAVLTDYAAMESYKGNTLASIFPSMQILAEFPRQVVILKTTGVICGLRGRRAGLQRRMIDEDQTRGFKEYCKALNLAKLGNTSVLAQILNNGRAADDQMQKILLDAAHLPNAVKDIACTFSFLELKAIRTGSYFPDSLIHKILAYILMLAQELFINHLHPTILGSREELPNTFLFRTALCVLLWALNWISTGRTGNANLARIRNDIIDINFAAYATYFDGIISKDRMPTDIYHRAIFILEAISAPP